MAIKSQPRAERRIDAALVRSLLEEQHPDLARLAWIRVLRQLERRSGDERARSGDGP
jgi:hypothetical protein